MFSSIRGSSVGRENPRSRQLHIRPAAEAARTLTRDSNAMRISRHVGPSLTVSVSANELSPSICRRKCVCAASYYGDFNERSFAGPLNNSQLKHAAIDGQTTDTRASVIAKRVDSGDTRVNTGPASSHGNTAGGGLSVNASCAGWTTMGREACAQSLCVDSGAVTGSTS
jgi:hypothetical protein